MRVLRRKEIIVSLLGIVALTAAAAVPFQLQPESRLWVEGTSTVRSFRCESGDLRGTITPAAGATSLAIADLESSIQSASIVTPVATLECGNGTMNGHMRRALKAQQHPAITFDLSSHRVAGASPQGTVTMMGRLTIAGQERPVTIEAVATEEPGGRLRVRGSKQLTMTEFGVTPPSLMLGTMKVRDNVVVHFDVLLTR